jgi:hypothetical protein
MGACGGESMSAEPMTTDPIMPVPCDRTKVADQGGTLCRPERSPSNPSAAFVRKRLQLQDELRALKGAHEQGLALDMAYAAKRMETAAQELATHLSSLLAHKARMEMRGSGRALIERKAQIKARVQGALYECRALRESIADLFEACLRREVSEPSAAWPNGRSPAESYPWLRRSLESSAIMIDRSLTVPDDQK